MDLLAAPREMRLSAFAIVSLAVAVGTMPGAAAHAPAVKLVALLVFIARLGRRLDPRRRLLCSTRLRGRGLGRRLELFLDLFTLYRARCTWRRSRWSRVLRSRAHTGEQVTSGRRCGLCAAKRVLNFAPHSLQTRSVFAMSPAVACKNTALRPLAQIVSR